MTELSEEEWRASVEGRLVALENLLVGMMSIQLGEGLHDPAGQLPDIRRKFFAGLQNVSRGTDPESELAWTHAVDAFNRHFDNLARRIESVARKRGGA